MWSWCIFSVLIMCILSHLYATGAAVILLELVLSSAACFCFLRITSWSFCFTAELATAPVNQKHKQPFKNLKKKDSPTGSSYKKNKWYTQCAGHCSQWLNNAEEITVHGWVCVMQGKVTGFFESMFVDISVCVHTEVTGGALSDQVNIDPVTLCAQTYCYN